MDVEWIFPIAKVGKYWREGRKLLDRGLRPSGIAFHRRMIEEKTHAFLGQLLSNPRAFLEHVDLLVPPHISLNPVNPPYSLQGKLVMHLTYGYDLKENDEILIPARRTSEIMSRLILPGAAFINHFPFRTVPLSPILI
jgi:hypothetical protein